MATQVSKKRKFVADGVFKAELNEFLTRELAEDGYSGVEVSDHIKLQPLPGSDTWFRFSGPRDSHQDRDHHHGHQDPERAGREGQEDQGVDQRRPEEVQLPRGNCRALRREGDLLLYVFTFESPKILTLQVATRGLCAIAQAESLRYKLIGGLAVRRACYGVLR